MITEEYIKRLRDMILPKLGEEGGAFIFGSSIHRDRFADVDIALWCTNRTTLSTIPDLQETFEESTFPYFVDLIDVVSTSDYFYNELLSTEKLWLSSEKSFPPRNKH